MTETPLDRDPPIRRPPWTDSLDRDHTGKRPPPQADFPWIETSPGQIHPTRNMGPETETPRRNMGLGSQTRSDIIQTPPVNRMTHASENITLPQTSFTGGKNKKKKAFSMQVRGFVVTEFFNIFVNDFGSKTSRSNRTCVFSWVTPYFNIFGRTLNEIPLHAFYKFHSWKFWLLGITIFCNIFLAKK